MASPKADDLDSPITMDDLFSMFGMSHDPQTDNSGPSDGLNLDKLSLAIKNHMESDAFKALLTSLESIEGDESDSDTAAFDFNDFPINIKDEYESLLPFLAPIEDGNYAADDFDFDAIMEHISNCSKHLNKSEAETSRDLFEIVQTGLRRGNIKKEQLETTPREGAERIKELAFWFKIPIRSSADEKIALRSDTLTFVRAVTCFPHFASLILYKEVGFAHDGAKSDLASEQLPDAMKHSGFSGLIPKCCDPYLMKAYLYANVAYVVDFGKLINPGDKRSLKEVALNQMKFCKGAVEKLPYTDEFRVGIFSVVGLSDPSVFKKIVEVCNNLCKVVGEPELTFETAEACHIKNDVICFFEDVCKDVAAREEYKDLADKLEFASIHGSSTSNN